MDTRPAEHATPTQSDPAIHWLSISAAIAAISAVGIALGLGLPLLSVVLQNAGISATMIGLNSAMAGIASIAIAPFCTGLAQRFGVADTMLVAIAVAAVSAMGFFWAPDFWIWFPLRVSFHGAITVLFILSEFWINAAAPPARRGFILGIYATVLSLGFATGPLLFSILGSEGALPFVVGTAIIVAAAIPIFMARRESPVIANRPSGPFLKFVIMVPTATAAVFVFGAVESGGFSLFPIYSSRIGFSEADGALLLTMIGLGNVLFQIPLGLVSDRVRDRRILLFICAAVGLLGCLLLPILASNWWLLATVLFVWGAVVAGLYTVGLAHLGSKLVDGDLASANAAFVFSYAIGMLIGPQMIGLAMDVMGSNGFAYSLAGFFLLYVGLAISRIIFRPATA
ncbi:MAG: MFS transporter [Alphaproteobacteria bacterium]|nr:MFS transporter [Alphaproteobacteria bacterium]